MEHLIAGEGMVTGAHPAMTIVKADRSGLPYFLFIFCVVEKSLQPAIRGFPTSYSFEKSETVLTT